MQHPRIATTASDASRVPTADDVRAELERILSSPHFQASQRRRTFLRFIIDETLAGRADHLKGYTVAVAIFGRDETFDAQADPVVRLEARRLRRDLDSYYVDAGSHDAVRISIPKGSYVPHFEWHEAPTPPAASGIEPLGRKADAGDDAGNRFPAGIDAVAWRGRARPRGMWFVAIVAAIVAMAVAGWMVTAGTNWSPSNHTAREPAVVVLPFEALNSVEASRHLAGGISQELIGNLMRFPGFRLYTLPISFDGNSNREPIKLGRDLGVAYVVSGTVRADAEEIRVAAQMINAGSGRVLWSNSYDRPLTPKALIRVQSDLSGDIATVLGQPYGVVNSDLRDRAATPAVSNMESYLCVLRAYGYRRSFSRDEFDPVLRCLQQAVRRDPDYSDAWAMLGWLHMDAGRLGYAGAAGMQSEYEQALQATSRAVQLDQNNTRALKALAAVNHFMGRYDESERIARQALQLNPYDPETLAQLGWRLAVRGKFEEGIPILKRAIDRSVNPPGWYYHLVAIDLYLKGQYQQMLQTAERSTSDGSGFSQVLIAIASGELGQRDAAQQALKKMSEYKPAAHDPEGFIRRHGATDQITDALLAGLRKARQVAAQK